MEAVKWKRHLFGELIFYGIIWDFTEEPGLSRQDLKLFRSGILFLFL